MLTPITLSPSQDCPKFPDPPDRSNETRNFLLYNRSLQTIVSDPKLGMAVVQHAFRRLVREAERKGAGNGAERAGLEIRWLADNRQKYAGRWVALDGDTLLVVGDSAREVYAAIAHHQGTPLVTRVEPVDESYFGGW